MGQRGFTLIELVIATALLASGMLVATISYTAISNLQQKGIAVRTVQESSRYVMDQIERDVRNSASITLVSPTDVKLANSIDASSLGEEYKYTNVGGKNDLLRCDFNGGSCTRVSDQNIRVTAVTFTYFATPDWAPSNTPYLKIDLSVSYDPTLSRFQTYSYSYDLSTTVSPRDQ